MGQVALWDEYRKGRDPATRDRILGEHLGLVHHVARKLQRRLSDQVEYDELLGPGTIGLMEAVESFDPDRGMAFSTFAVPRIRGAILDDLRRRDSVPRSVREKQSALREAEDALRQTLGREPTPTETAEALGIETEKLWSWQKTTRSAWRVSLDQPIQVSTGDAENTKLDAVIPAEESLADEAVEHEETVAQLSEAIAGLGERDRLVLTLYYYEELKLHQIADILGVTESRVSQIRSAALKRLRCELVD
ncbi:MAG: FliA/WhiG family RNA polymerase sigma factor [Gemmatimonadetes bacterium]|nr:FliA/WhiG family RNA polymerase sigma factor [Gemmatimonadota bacterium]